LTSQDAHFRGNSPSVARAPPKLWPVQMTLFGCFPPDNSASALAKCRCGLSSSVTAANCCRKPADQMVVNPEPPRMLYLHRSRVAKLPLRLWPMQTSQLGCWPPENSVNASRSAAGVAWCHPLRLQDAAGSLHGRVALLSGLATHAAHPLLGPQ